MRFSIQLLALSGLRTCDLRSWESFASFAAITPLPAMNPSNSDIPVVAGTTANPIPAAKKYKGMRAYAVFAAAGCEFMGERLQQLEVNAPNTVLRY